MTSGFGAGGSVFRRAEMFSALDDEPATATDHTPRKVVLKTELALGDIVCFTAAVRELHWQFPGEFLTDVRTPFPEIWENNPDITPLVDSDPDVEHFEIHYDRGRYASVNQSNQHPVHLIEGYCQGLAGALGLPTDLRPEQLKGHIFLSRSEYKQNSLPQQLHNVRRYWLICAGGKSDFPVKHLPPVYCQRVINHFEGRVQFVQVGAIEPGHTHPRLDGVIDLVGKTDIRQLIHTVHASCGVLCGITGLMHLAAAVPLPPWQTRPRPCVVVAGGREPRTWYGYQHHRILETVGLLPCCRDGGCWNSHTVPLVEEDPAEQIRQRLCERVINDWPKCMTMIRPESIILEIEKVLESEGIE